MALPHTGVLWQIIVDNVADSWLLVPTPLFFFMPGFLTNLGCLYAGMVVPSLNSIKVTNYFDRIRKCFPACTSRRDAAVMILIGKKNAQHVGHHSNLASPNLTRNESNRRNIPCGHLSRNSIVLQRDSFYGKGRSHVARVWTRLVASHFSWKDFVRFLPQERLTSSQGLRERRHSSAVRIFV